MMDVLPTVTFLFYFIQQSKSKIVYLKFVYFGFSYVIVSTTTEVSVVRCFLIMHHKVVTFSG